jgi:hypothetical protein
VPAGPRGHSPTRACGRLVAVAGVAASSGSLTRQISLWALATDQHPVGVRRLVIDSPAAAAAAAMPDCLPGAAKRWAAE